MRRPRDLDKYSTPEQVAALLESAAAKIREDAALHPYVRVSIDAWFWNPEWENKPKTNKSTSRSGQTGRANCEIKKEEDL